MPRGRKPQRSDFSAFACRRTQKGRWAIEEGSRNVQTPEMTIRSLELPQRATNALDPTLDNPPGDVSCNILNERA